MNSSCVGWICGGTKAPGGKVACQAKEHVSLSAPVERVVPISPLADLEPIALTAMNADLRLDAPEIASESPARVSLRPGVDAHVWVGAQERPAFLWQARLLSEAWSCPWTPESGKHHFDIVEGLTDPTSALLSVCLG
jgi:arylformamidase